MTEPPVNPGRFTASNSGSLDRSNWGKLLPSAPVETGWVVLADPEGNEFCAFTD